MLELTAATQIRRLTLVGAPDPLTTRLRVETLLAQLDVRPRGLSLEAVLVVRSLRLPSPERCTPLDARTLEGAIRARLDALLQQAARPAREAVPANARAVLFRDRAELLASLACDVLDSSAALHWWWRSLARLPSGTPDVEQAWQRSVEFAPAALRSLERVGRATAFVGSLSERSAGVLLETMLERHALLSSWPPLQRLVQSARPAAAQALRQICRGSADVRPGSDSVLRTALLEIGLCAAEQPHRLRRHEFRAQLEALAESATAPSAIIRERLGTPPSRVDAIVALAAFRPESLPAPQREPGSRLLSPQESALTRDGSRQVIRRVLDLEAPPVAPSVVASFPSRRPGQSAASAPTVAPAIAAVGARVPYQPSALAQQDTAVEAAAPEGTKAPHRSADRAPVPPWRSRAAADRSGAAPLLLPSESYERLVDTALGGVFFLVRVALSLELYADCSRPRDPGVALPIWDWLTLVAQRLLATDLQPTDELWALLAELAGRTRDEPAGAGHEPPEDWSFPSAWCSARDPAPERSPESLSDWIQGLSWRIQLRLAQALDIEPEQAGPLLLCHRARVHVTDTLLHVSLPLAEHPIEIRRAGLDRDLGWVPAAGKSIRFTFSCGECQQGWGAS